MTDGVLALGTHPRPVGWWAVVLLVGAASSVSCQPRHCPAVRAGLDDAVTCWLCCLYAGVMQVTIKLGTPANTMFSPGKAEPFATVYPTNMLNNKNKDNAVLKTSTLVLPLTWGPHGGWAIIENPNGPAEWCALTHSCKASSGPNVASAQRTPLAAVVPPACGLDSRPGHIVP